MQHDLTNRRADNDAEIIKMVYGRFILHGSESLPSVARKDNLQCTDVIWHLSVEICN